MKRFVKTALVFACLVFSPFAQLNLSTISSASVRDWSYVATIIDTCLFNTVISNGLAQTEMTLVMTPDGSAAKLDSIEISAWMQLPTDFVISDMYLWVNDKPVRAEIQDRSLASAQYEEVVNRRQDPCLIEFSGDGYYSMKIFPAKTGESRKVKIVFNHTIDDDSANLATACIPVIFDSLYYSYYENNSARPQLSYLSAELKSLDGNEYSFDMPGLGSGKFSSTRLFLEKAKVLSLSAGTISINDPSGSGEYLWAGADKNGKNTVGFSVMLAESTVTLEPEPETRIIVLDVREKMWDPDKYYNAQYEYYSGGLYNYEPYYNQQTVNVWLRAQKMAISCLQNYVNSSQKFNVIIAGATNTLIFDSPVAGTTDNLLAAGQAIALASPDKLAETDKALEAAIAQAGKGIVILITDLLRPYNYSRIIYDAAGNYKEEILSDDGKDFDLLITGLSTMVSESNINLFTIDDEWALWDIAHQSGGFRLATLRDVYYYTYAVEPYSMNGTEKYRPSLPGLFIDNPYNGGISGVKVLSDDASEIAFSLDGSGYYWWWGYDVMPAEGGIRKTKAPSPSGLRKMALPQYSSATGMLRVASVADASKALNFTVTGKMGGLSFTTRITGSSDAQSDIDSSVQLAFRKTEMLAQEDWLATADSIKKIGKDFHIVTRQTSLLALEPGMELWADTLSPQNSKDAGNGSEDLAAPSDERGGAYAENGVSLDSLSLEEMIAGLTAVESVFAKAKDRAFSAYVNNRTIRISIPALYRNSNVELKLFDLKGRLIVSKLLAPTEMATDDIRWDIGSHKTAAANGRYVLRILAAGSEKAIGLPVIK